MSIAFFGGGSLGKLLILSQVVLSIQLSFAVFPLVYFTSNKSLMGNFVNPGWIKALSILIAIIIAGLNLWLIKGVIFD